MKIFSVHCTTPSARDMVQYTGLCNVYAVEWELRISEIIKKKISKSMKILRN